MLMQCAMVALLPFIGALNQFGIDYGYRGRSRDEAWRSARRAFVILAVLSIAVVALRLEFQV